MLEESGEKEKLQSLETRVASWKWMKGKNVEMTEAASDLQPLSGDTDGAKQEAGNNLPWSSPHYMCWLALVSPVSKDEEL